MLASSMDRSHHGPEPRARLSHAAELDMVLAAQAGDAEARERLIEAFLPPVGSIARIYRGSAAIDRTELVQEGVVGLLRALQRYDPTLGTPFWAYASWWVRQAMQQLVSELTRAVVLSDRALRQLARVKDAQAEHVRANGREPTLLELASGCGLSRRQVQNLMAAERKPRALEEPLGGDDDLGGTLGDVLADPRAQDAYDMVPIRVEVDQLPRLLDGLSDREAIIVRARYGLDGAERTLQELAASLGVSAERVRQIEQVALDKMRAVAEA
ncbi:MAG: polymerase primary sigma factor [Solirubrobacteraceae bacterium]|jgi:RNA polymerase sigma factor (sigma-70 family)|nr:polymerase primary sigma factor [Solirubrobacteraceae bacterium]